MKANVFTIEIRKYYYYSVLYIGDDYYLLMKMIVRFNKINIFLNIIDTIVMFMRFFPLLVLFWPFLSKYLILK